MRPRAAIAAVASKHSTAEWSVHAVHSVVG